MILLKIQAALPFDFVQFLLVLLLPTWKAILVEWKARQPIASDVHLIL